MRRRKLHSIWLWGLLVLMTACGEDDYYYPSVKLEYVTIEAGEDGRIQTLLPDKGASLPVLEDRTGSSISPNTSRRVMSNYEVVSGGVKIYSLQSLITPMPKPEDDPVYENGVKTDPVEVVSIWLGRDYLNMILNLKVSTGKGHTFGIVEDTSELETKSIVDMLLYHDANSDEEYYNRRAYISVPLAQYIDRENPEQIKIKFYTCKKDGSVDKYYEFDYIPELN